MLTFCTEERAKQEGVVDISDSLIKSMTVGVAHVTQFRNELKLTGKNYCRSKQALQVFPFVGGVVKSVNVEVGDYVEKIRYLPL